MLWPFKAGLRSGGLGEEERVVRITDELGVMSVLVEFDWESALILALDVVEELLALDGGGPKA